MSKLIRSTRSVCPVCLCNIPAELKSHEYGHIYMEKECPKHGRFSTVVWKNAVDFDAWTEGADALKCGKGTECPTSCGLCAEHETGTCCVLLEVTDRCNLRCKYCFADVGRENDDPSLQDLKRAIEEISQKCKGALIQFSGGEPTLREDLPELITYAKNAGCSYTQVNTNGIRLAEDMEYVQQLAKAGLDIVFLQFDGTKDEIYTILRGRPLLEIKKKAIDNCSQAGLGVVLVPTVVKGVNDDDLGNLIRFACGRIPDVSGIHFQPVSFFGRYPNQPEKEDRYTLDELMLDISNQTGIDLESFMPSRCDHPLCGFHANYLVKETGELKALTSITSASHTRGTAARNREYVASNWKQSAEEKAPAPKLSEEMDFDAFLYYMNHRKLTLSAMAFQDAMNLNIERLHRCSLHVYDRGKIVPFCAKYLSKMQ